MLSPLSVALALSWRQASTGKSLMLTDFTSFVILISFCDISSHFIDGVNCQFNTGKDIGVLSFAVMFGIHEPLNFHNGGFSVNQALDQIIFDFYFIVFHFNSPSPTPGSAGGWGLSACVKDRGHWVFAERKDGFISFPHNDLAAGSFAFNVVDGHGFGGALHNLVRENAVVVACASGFVCLACLEFHFKISFHAPCGAVGVIWLSALLFPVLFSILSWC
jgi:hypothetical protein